EVVVRIPLVGYSHRHVLVAREPTVVGDEAEHIHTRGGKRCSGRDLAVLRQRRRRSSWSEWGRASSGPEFRGELLRRERHVTRPPIDDPAGPGAANPPNRATIAAAPHPGPGPAQHTAR